MQPHLHIVALRTLEPVFLGAAHGHVFEQSVVEGFNALGFLQSCLASLVQLADLNATGVVRAVKKRHQLASGFVKGMHRAARHQHGRLG